MSGEAVPGTKLWIIDGDKRTDVALQGHTWSVNLADTTLSDRAVLHIEKGGSEITAPLQKTAQGQN